MTEAPAIRPPEVKARLPHEPGRWKPSPGLSVGWRRRVRVVDGLARIAAVNPPDPAFPGGCDLDLSDGAPMTCATNLPAYPGKLGRYEIRCQTCDLSVAIISVGRADDARAVRVRCRGRTA